MALPIVSQALEWLLLTPIFASKVVYMLHVLNTCIKYRTTKAWSNEETKKSPLASFLTIYTVTVGGKLLLGFLFRQQKSVFGVLFGDIEQVIAFAVVWTAVNFTPGDLVFNICSGTPSKFLLSLFAGWKRVRDVISAVSLAQGENVLTHAVVGIVGAWGGSLLFPYEAQMRGKTVPNDLFQPSKIFRQLFVLVPAYCIANVNALTKVYAPQAFLLLTLALVVYEFLPQRSQPPSQKTVPIPEAKETGSKSTRARSSSRSRKKTN